ncbi:MAG: hypothetical protein KAH84_11390 [Thiomargarita sp.]|nr:hypothetical protein [Thiomargarita sp.]
MHNNYTLKITFLIAIFLVSCVPQQITQNTPQPPDNPIVNVVQHHEKIKKVDKILVKPKLPLEEIKPANTNVLFANQDYYNSLETAILIKKAENFYENQQYKKALYTFELTRKRPDAELVRVYGGLYQTYLKMQNQTAAEEAFSELLAANLKEKKDEKLNFKFLFSMNSDDFINDDDLKQEYHFWLQQIATFLEKRQLCIHIIGYSTTDEINEFPNLSKLRAKKIQLTMQNTFADIQQNSEIMGENDNGGFLGTVEIMIVDCFDEVIDMTN